MHDWKGDYRGNYKLELSAGEYCICISRDYDGIYEFKLTFSSKAANSPTVINIKNKKTYKRSKKVTIKDADGIQQIKINSFTIHGSGPGKHEFVEMQNEKLLFI